MYTKWSEIIQDLSKERRKENELFNDSLKPPAFTHDNWGYWKLEDGSGIIKMRLFDNGYDKRSMIILSKEEIEKIIKLWA
jgi:hypothetical protein